LESCETEPITLKSQLYFWRRAGGNEFIMLRAGNSISVKRAYIGGCPEMTGCRLAKSAILAQFRYLGVIPMSFRSRSPHKGH